MLAYCIHLCFPHQYAFIYFNLLAVHFSSVLLCVGKKLLLQSKFFYLHFYFWSMHCYGFCCCCCCCRCCFSWVNAVQFHLSVSMSDMLRIAICVWAYMTIHIIKCMLSLWKYGEKTHKNEHTHAHYVRSGKSENKLSQIGISAALQRIWIDWKTLFMHSTIMQSHETTLNWYNSQNEYIKRQNWMA